MKTLHRFFSSTLLLFGFSAFAQVEVSMTFSNTTFLTCEPVLAMVTINNKTATTIPVGGSDGYNLSFDVKNSDGHAVLPSERTAVATVSLPPGGTIVVTNDLFATHKLLGERQVIVAAVLNYQERTFVSKKTHLDIQDGTEIARLRVSDGTRTLTQTLRVLLRSRHEHLFLRADDESLGVTFGASDLGTLLRSPAPQYMVDGEKNTHVLHRSGPEAFTYHIANPDGSLIKREQFVGDYKLVRLIAGADGKVTCNGSPSDKSDRPQILQQTPFRPDLHSQSKPR